MISYVTLLRAYEKPNANNLDTERALLLWINFKSREVANFFPPPPTALIFSQKLKADIGKKM